MFESESDRNRLGLAMTTVTELTEWGGNYLLCHRLNSYPLKSPGRFSHSVAAGRKIHRLGEPWQVMAAGSTVQCSSAFITAGVLIGD